MATLIFSETFFPANFLASIILKKLKPNKKKQHENKVIDMLANN